jgi:hypothetical protein
VFLARFGVRSRGFALQRVWLGIGIGRRVAGSCRTCCLPVAGLERWQSLDRRRRIAQPQHGVVFRSCAPVGVPHDPLGNLRGAGDRCSEVLSRVRSPPAERLPGRLRVVHVSCS